MANKLKREIECLQRLQDLTGQLEDILQFLKLENLVNDNQLKTVKLSADHAKEVQSILRNLQIEGKLQLLEYQLRLLQLELSYTTRLSMHRNLKMLQKGWELQLSKHNHCHTSLQRIIRI